MMPIRASIPRLFLMESSCGSGYAEADLKGAIPGLKGQTLGHPAPCDVAKLEYSKIEECRSS